MTPERRAGLIKRRSREVGFDAVGITDLQPPPHAEAFRRWLEVGMAGTMTYMSHQASRRLDPRTIVAGAGRAVVLVKNYFQPDPPPHTGTGRVAKYARGEDYHVALKPPLQELAQYVRSLGTPDTIAEWYVDFGPVPERELAQRAGLGWIGKNTMLIDPTRGSYFFLAAVLTDLEIAVDQPFEADRCGSCRRCLDACPTDAFPEERVLDSRRCISYLTIEHRGEIDPSIHEAMGDWVFGCDICQDVCPWNVKFAVADADSQLGADPALASLDLLELATITDDAFDSRFGWTALERPGPNGMRRNARIALHNIGEASSWPTSLPR